ncbi:hypothetical protein AB4Y36_29635 [Paraburkholderia sp. BR10936]
MKDVSDSYRKAFDIGCSSFLKIACSTYLACAGKDATEIAFLESIYNPMLTDTQLDPKAIQAALPKGKRPEYTEYLRLACAFQIASISTFDSGNGPQAWLYLCRANYYIGRTHRAAMATVGAQRVISSRGRKNASVGKEKYGQVKEYAVGLLKLPHTFPNRNQAAIHLAQQVFDFQKEKNIGMSEGNIIKKLNDWFREAGF